MGDQRQNDLLRGYHFGTTSVFENNRARGDRVMEEFEIQKDKNGTILKIHDKVKDLKGEVWKLENVRGVTLALRYNAKNQIVESKVLRKLNLDECEKIV